MSRIPLIVGTGLVTPLGETAPDTWAALLAGRFITDHARLSCESSKDLPRVSVLARRAAREALSQVGPDWVSDAALVVGTSKGAIESWLAASRPPESCLAGDFGLSQVASDLSQLLGQSGARLTLSAACASGLHALIRGTMLIRSGEARRVLIVASEAAVHPLFVGSFRRLGVLAPEGLGCRPFDRQRNGFLMSEAAAAVCLESTDPDRARGIRVDGFAMASDATHLTGSSPEMSALGHVLNVASGPEPIDLFHAHATGTLANDAAELRVIENHAAGYHSSSCVYSHKGALGHSQGAAGLVSVVINVLSHREGTVPPNVRTTDPLPAGNLVLSAKPVQRKLRTSVAMAAGFGGPVAAVRLVSQS